MAVREEMWAQAARDRDALEAELGARHEGERERLLEEAQERTNAMVEEVQCHSECASRCPQSTANPVVPLCPMCWFYLLFVSLPCRGYLSRECTYPCNSAHRPQSRSRDHIFPVSSLQFPSFR